MFTSSDWYSFAKDFSGPVSTIIASATAAYIAWTLQHRQIEIARSKLNLDLFDRRYAAFQRIDKAMNDVAIAIMLDEERPGDRLGIIRTTVDNAESFLSPTNIRFLRDCEKVVINALNSDTGLDDLFDRQKLLSIVFKPELRI